MVMNQHIIDDTLFLMGAEGRKEIDYICGRHDCGFYDSNSPLCSMCEENYSGIKRLLYCNG